MPAGDVSWYWARRKSCEYTVSKPNFGRHWGHWDTHSPLWLTHLVCNARLHGEPHQTYLPLPWHRCCVSNLHRCCPLWDMVLFQLAVVSIASLVREEIYHLRTHWFSMHHSNLHHPSTCRPSTHHPSMCHLSTCCCTCCPSMCHCTRHPSLCHCKHHPSLCHCKRHPSTSRPSTCHPSTCCCSTHHPSMCCPSTRPFNT